MFCCILHYTYNRACVILVIVNQVSFAALCIAVFVMAFIITEGNTTLCCQKGGEWCSFERFWEVSGG